MNIAGTATRLDVERIRKDFPALHQEVYGKPLAYLDNAATSQKPRQVIERISRYYEQENSNVHRGVHYLSQVATEAYEASRECVRSFIGAAHTEEIIYTRGTTEAINLVAYSFGAKYLKEGDEILISAMEHHANIVPWQMLCERSGAVLRVIPMDTRGVLDMDAYRQLLNAKTRIVSVVWISNALGTINPVEEIIALAHAQGTPVLLDAAQAAPHTRINVQALDADFLTFSGHKVLGPTGIGVLYGKKKWLEEMPPFMGGGDMIDRVTFEKTTYNGLPHKFEAGTPHIAGAIGLHSALDYMDSIGVEAIAAWEQELLEYATAQLSAIPGIRLIGTAPNKASVLSFLIGEIHPYDAGTILNQMGIAVRTGHHCAQPIMDHFGIPGTLRASFAFYNTKEEVDRLSEAVLKVIKMFGI